MNEASNPNGSGAQAGASGLLEHLFRRESGRIIAYLARTLGPGRLDLAEEAAQDAMVRELLTWPHHGVPDNPAAWLFRTAHNAAVDALRRRRFDANPEDAPATLSQAAGTPGDPKFEEQLRDDELRMIFMCCHPELSRESSVALSLKIAGGLSVREIARAFLVEESAIAQRLVRAKRQIRERHLSLDLPAHGDLAVRLDAVVETIYFIFNEGYSALEGEDLIRRDLCFEALRLGQLLASSALADPRIHALVALMALQAARLGARTNSAGDLILLEDQDRAQWDQELIALGFQEFDRSISGNVVTEYHIQAAIAATHTRWRDLNSTDWPTILALYDQLLGITDSPVVALNRAVALAKVEGPAVALAAIEPIKDHPSLHDYYLAPAVRGHLLLELGRSEDAAETFRNALECRCSEPERRFLRRKLEQCSQ
jgi:RNA polymerase sigma-70 factor (ECF subfamily)